MGVRDEEKKLNIENKLIDKDYINILDNYFYDYVANDVMYFKIMSIWCENEYLYFYGANRVWNDRIGKNIWSVVYI